MPQLLQHGDSSMSTSDKPSSIAHQKQLLAASQTVVALMLLHNLQKLVGSYGATNELKADHAPTAAAEELLHPSIAGVADEARVVHPGHLQSTSSSSTHYAEHSASLKVSDQLCSAMLQFR